MTLAISRHPAARLYETIVIAVDDAAESMDALLLATLLAEPSKARLIVAHVSPVSRWVREEMREPLAAAIAQRAQEVLAPARRALAGCPAVEFLTLMDESVPRALSNLAEEVKAELVVVGSAHRAGVGRVMPGSTSNHLLNGVACQVAVAPRGFHLGVFPPKLNVIGVAYDGSPESTDALELGKELSSQLHAQLRVIRVLDPAEAIAPLAYAYGIPPHEGHLLEIRRSTYDEIAEIVAHSTVPIKPVVLDGPAAKELIDCSHEVSLLILGSRRFGPAHNVLMGATSSQVMRAARAPVLLVPRCTNISDELPDNQAALSAMCT
jgi:nucleotide-binding universal stress UspA family protein